MQCSCAPNGGACGFTSNSRSTRCQTQWRRLSGSAFVPLPLLHLLPSPFHLLRPPSATLCSLLTSLSLSPVPLPLPCPSPSPSPPLLSPGHTAMLLGAARQLAEQRNFRGTVHLVFQAGQGRAGQGRAGQGRALDSCPSRIRLNVLSAACVRSLTSHPAVLLILPLPISQPAEEGTPTSNRFGLHGGGALAMLEGGLLSKYPVRAAFGMHNW